MSVDPFPTPSGAVYHIKTPRLLDLLIDGEIPAPFVADVEALIIERSTEIGFQSADEREKQKAVPEEGEARNVRFARAVIAAICVEPRIALTIEEARGYKAEGIPFKHIWEVPVPDQLAIYYAALKEDAALKQVFRRFKSRKAAVAALSDGTIRESVTESGIATDQPVGNLPG